MAFKITKKEKKAAKTARDNVGVADATMRKLINEPIPYCAKEDRKAIERLITGRVTLLLKHPFYGNLASRLILRNADEWCPTAATDGRYFYYNSRFVNSLRDEEVNFLVGHEILHIVYDHMGRRVSRNPKIWNIATDYLVNMDLVDNQVGELITTIEILYDNKYRGYTSEAVYNELLEEAKKEQKKNGGGQGTGNMPTDEEIEDALGDLVDKILDEHMTDEQGDGQNDQDDGSNDDGSGVGTAGPVPMTDAERKQLKDEIRGAVINAAKQAGSKHTPDGVKRMLHELTQPKISWQDLIAQEIESTIKNDFSWVKPSRNSWHIDAVLPGMIPGKQIDVCIGIDTSGSITDEMLCNFLSEVDGIMEQYSDYKIQLWCFDTSIHNPQKYTSDNMRSIAEYQPGGGGGTEFTVNWKYMKENDIQPDKFIMFTDGYPFGSWGDPDYCDTVWVIHGNKNDEPPFGIWAYYDEL